MPTDDQVTDDAADDPLNLPASRWPSLADDYSRTNSDKSNIGIPAAENGVWLVLPEHNPLPYTSSAGKVSFGQGSWETVSATSHGSSQSFQNPICIQYNNLDSNSYQGESNALPIMVNAPSTRSMNEVKSLSSDAGLIMDGYRTGSSDPISFTPEASSPGPSLRYTDYSWVDNLTFRNNVEPGAAQDDFFASADLDSTYLNQFTEPVDQYQPPDQVLMDLTSAEHASSSMRPVIELPDDDKMFNAPKMSYLDVPAIKTHLSSKEKGGPQGAGQQINKKRKRAATRKRENVDKINSVRDIGACIRCSLLHEPCDAGNPCATCQSNAHGARIWRQPCIRLRLSDAEIHRTGALSFPEGIRTPTWRSGKTITISLYNVGFAAPFVVPSSRPSLRVVCREFCPLEGDPLAKSWITGGNRRDLPLPAYAIPPAHQKELNDSVDTLMSEHRDKLLAELQFQYGQDEIVSRTLAEAARLVNTSSVLADALSIAIMTRLSMKSFNITGPETLGIPQVEDPDSPYYGRIPIPPFLDGQLDHLWMGKTNGKRKALLSQLNKLIKNKTKRKENWFMIFLSILILLSNLELIYQNQHQQRERYRKTNHRQDTMMSAWKHAAETLITYYHVIFPGNVPLYTDWNEEAQNAFCLDDQSIHFLYELKVLAGCRVEELRQRARDPPHVPLAWVSALLLGQD